MSKPDYFAPGSLDEALVVLKEHMAEARIIAGGTDLLPLMRAGEIKPALLVDLRLLPLQDIKFEDDEIRLGARLTHAQIIDSGKLAKAFPVLVEACREIAGPSIRNRGTLGGNLANASPAADTAPPLLVYDACVVLANGVSQRIVPLAEFFCGPGATVLENAEVLTEVRVPLMPPKTSAKFIKLGKRRAMAIAVVSAAVRLTLDANDQVAQARIALGSVAPIPVRADAAEAMLEGNDLTEELIAQAAQEASRATTPISDIRASAGYRKKMVDVLVRRALKSAWNQLKGDVGHGRN